MAVEKTLKEIKRKRALEKALGKAFKENKREMALEKAKQISSSSPVAVFRSLSSLSSLLHSCLSCFSRLREKLSLGEKRQGFPVLWLRLDNKAVISTIIFYWC
jgi:hypothetical protein